MLVAALAAVVAGPAPLVVAVVAPATLPLWLSVRATRRRRALEEQLPEVLTLLAACLKAGHSFSQALQAVAEDADEPARGEFARVLTEARLGRPLDEVLDAFGRRIGSPELDFVLGAVAIQRRVGGSLAGLLDTVAETIRGRAQFTRKVRALTAMGRTSAIVLVVLPFAMAALLTLINPRYMEPLWATHVGRLLVAGALASVAVGALLLRRIVAIRC
jgi:tight adherence protein B